MKLLGKVGIVSAMTGISRVFGLVREIFMAHYFGTTNLQSAFVIAFRIPNLFRRLFGEGALAAAFIPIFTEVERNEGRERAQLFAARILGMLVCILGLLVGLGIAASFGVEVICGEGSRWTEAMPLMRIMLPYALLICIVGILAGILQVQGRFAVSTLTPAVLNIVWLVVLLGIVPFLPAEGMWRIGAVCWGILIAGAVQIVFLLPALKRLGYGLRFSFRGWSTSPYIKQVILQMGPASLGIALAQINICMDGWLAFYGASWAPAALEYADRIIYLPLGLFGTAFATVLLPTYSKQIAEGKPQEMVETLTRSLQNLLLIITPMAAGLWTLAVPVVALIYQRGAFGPDSVIWTARAVAAYAPGILIFSLSKVINPCFYAQTDIQTPVKVAGWCILGNFTLNVLSVLLLPEGWRHAGIATSTVLNSLANTVILLIILRRRGLSPKLRPLIKTLCLTLLATLPMVAATLGTHWLFRQYWGLPLFISVPVAMAAAVIYFPIIALLAPRQFRDAITEFPLPRKLRRFLPHK